jgi:hypothetical protein
MHILTPEKKKIRRLTDGVNLRKLPHVLTLPMRLLPVTFQRGAWGSVVVKALRY